MAHLASKLSARRSDLEAENAALHRGISELRARLRASCGTISAREAADWLTAIEVAALSAGANSGGRD